MSTLDSLIRFFIQNETVSVTAQYVLLRAALNLLPISVNDNWMNTFLYGTEIVSMLDQTQSGTHFQKIHLTLKYFLSAHSVGSSESHSSTNFIMKVIESCNST